MADAVANPSERGANLWQRIIRRAWKSPAETESSQPIEAETKDQSPVAYQTFSKNLAPALTAIGGILALAGGLGAWVRATQVIAEGLPPEQVRVEMGYRYDTGIALGILGGIALVSSILWLGRRLLPKILPVGISIAIVALAAWRLPIVDRWAADFARDARSGEVEFIAYHAGFGWGAWLLVVSCVLLALGVVIGVLREIDVRKGRA